MDPKRPLFPTPDHAELKAWACRFAPSLLEGASHPAWPDGKADDVADALLLGWWWLDKHRAEGDERRDEGVVVAEAALLAVWMVLEASATEGEVELL